MDIVWAISRSSPQELAAKHVPMPPLVLLLALC